MSYRLTILIIITVSVMLPIAVFASSPGLDTDQLAEDRLVAQDMTSRLLTFIENRGQWNSQTRFVAVTDNVAFWLRQNEVIYQFTKPSTSCNKTPDDLAIRVTFPGACSSPAVAGDNLCSLKCNYFVGRDPELWHTGVNNWEAVAYRDLYLGIDLVYRGNGEYLEYDFVVAPGTDPGQIAVHYEGVDSLSVNWAGELLSYTSWGVFVERKPFAYQHQESTLSEVEVECTLLGDNSFGFQFPEGYDSERTLVIDPILSYSTYLGGVGQETPRSLVTDSSGNVYITGQTRSPDFPILNPHVDTYKYRDVFITKLAPSGEPVYSTYLGGTSEDWGLAIAVDQDGSAFVAGWTRSEDFPTTPAAFCPDYNGGYSDAYVVKLAPSGDSLIFGTFLGGGVTDEAHGLDIDNSGNTYVVGMTESPTYPVTTGACGQIFTGDGMAFVTKIEPSGDSLVYSAIIGGSVTESAIAIAVDTSGAAYVAGETTSPNFPVWHAMDTTVEEGDQDIFISKISPDGSSFIYSTYLGGDVRESPTAVALDHLNRLHITGWTRSSDFPISEYAYGYSSLGGQDIFVAAVDTNGNNLIHSTFLGGKGDDIAYGIALDKYRNVYVTGRTTSADFPTFKAKSETLRGFSDAFVTKFDRFCYRLKYSTYLGGNTLDTGYDLAVDPDDALWVTGTTWSPAFVTTDDAHDATYGGDGDGFVIKIVDSSCCQPPMVGDIDGFCSGNYCVDGADLSMLIDYLFISMGQLPCLQEADLDLSDEMEYPTDLSVDGADLSILIEHLFVSYRPLSECP